MPYTLKIPTNFTPQINKEQFFKNVYFNHVILKHKNLGATIAQPCCILRAKEEYRHELNVKKLIFK